MKGFKQGLAVFGLVSFGMAAFAQADAPKVDITSFVYVNNSGRVAELCGKATGLTAAALVRVVVDVHSGNPGVYNVMSGQDGHFCTVVASYQGTAAASLESLGGGEGRITSAVATATRGTR